MDPASFLCSLYQSANIAVQWMQLVNPTMSLDFYQIRNRAWKLFAADVDSLRSCKLRSQAGQAEPVFVIRSKPRPPGNTPVRLVTFTWPKGQHRPYAGVMKTPVSKDALTTMALFVCFSVVTNGLFAQRSLPIAQSVQPITITMTAEHWQTKDNAEFLRQLGFYHGLMRLNSGDAVLKDITFSDGTIEFDVNTIGRGAPGIAFRQQDEGNFELLYLRDHSKITRHR